MTAQAYEIIFVCYACDYYYTVDQHLTLEQANEKIASYEYQSYHVHPGKGCCHHYAQKIQPSKEREKHDNEDNHTKTNTCRFGPCV